MINLKTRGVPDEPIVHFSVKGGYVGETTGETGMTGLRLQMTGPVSGQMPVSCLQTFSLPLTILHWNQICFPPEDIQRIGLDSLVNRFSHMGVKAGQYHAQ